MKTMKKLLLIASMIALTAPAMAEEIVPDDATAKTMVECSVLLKDEAALAREDNAMEEAKDYETVANRFSISALAFMQGERDTFKAKFEGWQKGYEVTVQGFDADTADKKMKECLTLEPKVEAVLELIRNDLK